MRKPHLLYISFAFPPSTASSVYRCTAVANAFAADGWDVTVLTLDPGTWSEISGIDEKLAASVDPRITVVPVSDGGAEEPARGNLRGYSRLRIEAPYLWKEALRRKSRKEFPEDFHGAWLGPAGEAARRVHRDKPVDLVMASASPYVSFAVARVLPGVPYVMDYRDAWAFNTISGAEDFGPASDRGRLEASYLRDAEQIWFVNDQIRDEYARRYPESEARMRVVANGFDPQPGHAKPQARATAEPRFGYLGTLQYVNMPLQEFLDGWSSAVGQGMAGEAVFRGKLSASGAAGAEILDIFGSGRYPGLRYDGPISKREVAGFYQEMDALLLLLSTGRYVTGGKTAEYLATGRPIVSVHDLGNAATDLLRDYPLWFPAKDLSADAIAEALRDCAREVASPDAARWDAAWEYGQQFLRSTILEPVIAELRSTAGVPAVAPAVVDGTDARTGTVETVATTEGREA
ncbi:glycosyltransferase [Arthrobacter woluwensis]|uniref:Glycosyltransferase involved in cell wall bisynthesis n=1 Tax=Arthrobacter woluwensis TaxID=156980 RepID=A0A1H4MYE7_9MICC|nr:glycosyltransferase [Arthrobacter woluwensis]SEB87847.1 Glycosyltransferase involved in cell wall bisynthesis [Arthrobacter woluwensis]